MIVGARRIKDLIRNRSDGDSLKAQMLLRHYAMERLLERLSVSKYANDFIIKGGILVSSLIGIDERLTRDVDVTVRGHSLTKDNLASIFKEISQLDMGDGFSFELGEPCDIMEDSEYGGIRIPIYANIEKTRTAFKVDISTGDAITPHDVDLAYSLMFEDREISLRAYNLETVLAEKLETIFALSTQTTRMRDFYDVFMLINLVEKSIDYKLLREALEATMKVRNSQFLIEDAGMTIEMLSKSNEMFELWNRYVNSNPFARGISWKDAIEAVRILVERIS